ncbi:MAG: glycosyltransferase family 2 protein [Planctomycetota bacterium]
MTNDSPTIADLLLSVVAPAHNEEGNIDDLIREVEAGARACTEAYGGRDGFPEGFECIIVDDASTDATADRVRVLMSERPWLRMLMMPKPASGGGNGQSAAFQAGFRAARGVFIAVLDADLQNDPAEFPKMMSLLMEHKADLVQGDRSRNRKDNWVKRRGSEVGRLFRRMILGDKVRDTGCSLRIMRATYARRLPLEFKGIHRFIPASFQQMEATVVEMDVHHRARHAGETKYGNLGISKRAIPGLIDCFAVRWMGTRRRSTVASEVGAESTGEP